MVPGSPSSTPSLQRQSTIRTGVGQRSSVTLQTRLVEGPIASEISPQHQNDVEDSRADRRFDAMARLARVAHERPSQGSTSVRPPRRSDRATIPCRQDARRKGMSAWAGVQLFDGPANRGTRSSPARKDEGPTRPGRATATARAQPQPPSSSLLRRTVFSSVDVAPFILAKGLRNHRHPG